MGLAPLLLACCLCALAGMPGSADASKILWSLTPRGHSHTLGMRSIAHEVASRGHEVLVRARALSRGGT